MVYENNILIKNKQSFELVQEIENYQLKYTYEEGVEAKVGGLGFSVGKKMGISTPIGGVSVDLSLCCAVSVIEKFQMAKKSKSLLFSPEWIDEGIIVKNVLLN